MKELSFRFRVRSLARAVFYLTGLVSLLSMVVLAGCAGRSGLVEQAGSGAMSGPISDLAGVELSAGEQAGIARNDLNKALFSGERKTWLFSARYQRQGWTGTYDIPVLVLLQPESESESGPEPGPCSGKQRVLVSILDATGLNYGTFRLDSKDYETLKVLHPRLQGLLTDFAESLRIIFLTAQPMATDQMLLPQGSGPGAYRLLGVRPFTWRDKAYFLEMAYERSALSQSPDHLSSQAPSHTASPALPLSKKSLHGKINKNGGSGREIWTMYFTWPPSQTLRQTSLQALPAKIDLSVWGHYSLKMELIK